MSTTGFAYRNDYELSVRHRQPSSTDMVFQNAVSSSKVETNEQHRPSSTRKIIKCFLFQKTSILSQNWSIEETTCHSRTAAYFAVVCPANLMRPDVVLHAGSDRTGKVLGASRFRFSRHITLGFGDPERDANSVVWEQMRNTSYWFWNMKFQFQFDTRSGGIEEFSPELQGSHNRRRRRFLWEQTSDCKDGVEGLMRKFALRNFRLVDLETDTAIAVFLASSWSMVELGELRIHERVDEDLEIAIILTCASMNRMLDKRLRWTRR